MPGFDTLFQIYILGNLRWGFSFAFFIYAVFGLMVIRQVQFMNRVLTNRFFPVMRKAAIIHAVLAWLLFLVSLLI